MGVTANSSIGEASRLQPRPTGLCPKCGYDQRGLPPGTSCPECGEVFWPGRVVSDVNRWTDRTLLDLWCITLLLVVSMAIRLLTIGLVSSSLAAGVMLETLLAVYQLAATVWFAVVVAFCMRRRLSPNYLNIAEHRRRKLVQWLAMDSLLVALGWFQLFVLSVL